MANAWGELSWNAGNWGEQNDITVSVTGVGGNPIAYGQRTFGSSSFGGESQNIPLNLGEETISTEINSGWGGEAWGDNAWGILGDVLVSGISLSVNVGSITEINGDANVIPTGSQLSLNIGQVEGFGLALVPVTGSQINISQGDESVDLNNIYSLSGIEISANLGTVVGQNEQGWGRDDWGSEVWGAEGIWQTVSVSGESLSISSGEQEAWGELTWGTYEWGGISVTDVDIKTFAAVTGQELTAAEGTVDPSPDATVVGIGLSASLAVGSVIEADANVVINNDILPTFTAEGDAQLSTAQAKFGPSSLLLDGTGDFVQSTASPVVQNNFTIEFFAYASNFAQDAYLWDNSLSSQGFAFSITQFGQLRLIQDGTILQQTSTPSLNNNQWNHFALVQNSTLLTLYINGTPKLQYSTGGDSYPGQSYKIGTNEGETQFFNGYIDEFRSSDIARYTGLFTPPTSAFTADGNTISLLHFDGANGSTNIVNSTGSDIPRIALGLAQGQAELDAVTFAETSGQQLDFALNSVVAGASAEVSPTGVQANINTGNINIQAWQIVDTGTSVAYTEVSTGSDVTWNDIDTAA